MSKYTSEEKQELVETIKGPRYYRIQLWGYGGEAAYLNLSKEAYEFWNNVVEEDGSDSNLVNYMVNAEDGDLDDLEVIVPPEAMFMQEEDAGDVTAYPWYEAPGEFCHQNGVEYSNAHITVEEIESEDYSAKHIADVLDESVEEMVDKIHEDSEYELELLDSGEAETWEDEGDYVCQFYSSEKGTFFEGILETVGDFDPKKLKFVINEYPNGEDIIDGVLYDGNDIDNQGGDTNGKGYSAHLWKNV